MIMKKVYLLVFGLILVTSAWSQQSDRELFNEAESRFETQDFELAIERYQTLVESHPLSPFVADSQFRTAVAFYRLGRFDEANALLARVDARYRSTRYLAYVPFWRGVVSYELGSFAEAIKFLESYISEQPGAVPAEPASQSAQSADDLENQAYLYLALAYRETGQARQASASLATLFSDEESPEEFPYALALLMSLYIAESDSSDALALYERTVVSEIAPSWRPYVDLYAAEAYRIGGVEESAIELYRELEMAPPSVATVAFQRLFYFSQIGLVTDDPADIVLRAERSLAGQSEVLREFWLRVGIDSYDDGRLELAELYFRRIWDFRRTDEIPSSVALYLADLLDRRGDLQGAEAVLAEYLEIYGDAAAERQRILVNLGNLQLRLGNVDAAQITLSSAVNDFPNGEFFGEAAYQYAYLLREIDEPAQALSAIDSVFTTGLFGSAQADLLRLRARLLGELGRTTDALQSLYEYLPVRPDDAEAQLEYLKTLFELGRHQRVVDEAQRLFADSPAGSSVARQIDYIVGLSYVSIKEYDSAIAALSRIVDSGVSNPVLEEIRPYARYYRGWARYRLGAYAHAVNDLDALIAQAPSHPLAARASYLSGWANFQLGAFSDAAEKLILVRSYTVTPELELDARFLLARTLVAQDNRGQAAAEFRSIYLDFPSSAYADDAWFEFGQVQSSMGSVDAAVEAFDRLAELYPSSALVEDAVHRKAEVLFADKRYGEARDAYFEYRNLYPSGRFMDVALYWGGQSSVELRESAGALLLWERLIAEYRSSTYRADAMRMAAALYQEREEYRDALNLYTELLAAYPEIAESVNAERRRDELVLLISGLSQREAELYVRIENTGGADTADGRLAIIELARIAILEETSAGTESSTVVPMLEAVAAAASVDPVSAAQARYLIGEHLYRQADFTGAADEFLLAAAGSASDRDLAALSLLRAAQMYSTAGRTAEVRELVTKLEEEFPRSDWLEEARTLLRENE